MKGLTSNYSDSESLDRRFCHEMGSDQGSHKSSWHKFFSSRSGTPHNGVNYVGHSRSCGEISDPEELVGTYTNVLNEMIEKHAPLRTKTITLRPTCPWFTEELHAAKHTRRKLERKWRNSGLAIDHEIYRKYCAEVNKKLQKTRETYLSEKDHVQNN